MKPEEIKSGMYISLDYNDEWIFLRIINVEGRNLNSRYKVEVIRPKQGFVSETFINYNIWEYELSSAKEVDAKLFYKLKNAIQIYQTTIETILNKEP